MNSCGTNQVMRLGSQRVDLLKHALRAFTAIMLLALCVDVALAVPPLPYSPWGEVAIGGSPAPDGVTVIAWIGTMPLAQTHTLNGYYTLDVPGDDADTVGVVEGGTAGSVVRFTVDGREALPDGTWTSGSRVQHNLTAVAASGQHILYLPVIVVP